MPSTSRPSSRQVRSSRPSSPSIPLSQSPNGLSAPSVSAQAIKGCPCVYTKEYQEYYVKGMERLEKGKGKEWSIKKREFQVMKEWEEEWRSRNSSENGGEQESISQDGDLSENGVAFSKSTVEDKSLDLPYQQNSIPALLHDSPSSSDSSSSSDPNSDCDQLPSSITHAIQSEVRKIYEHPKKKSTSSTLGPQRGSAEVEVEIEEGGQKHMHWLEQGNDGEEEQVEKQRNLEDEMDEQENDDYLSNEDMHVKMGSLLERIGDKHQEEEGEMVEMREIREIREMGEKIEEIGGILEESVTAIQGVVEMEEDEEDEEVNEQRQELEKQARQTLANPDLLQQLKDNYRCDCYDDDKDQEMMKGITGGDEYGMGIEGGLNSEDEEGGGDDSDSLSNSISLQQPQHPSLPPSTGQHSTIPEETKSNKLKNLKKKEQKKRKKEEKKRAKLAEELEKVKGEKRKAVDEVVSTTEGGSSEKKRKRRVRKAKD